MGVLRPLPQLGGAHTAWIPAPPGTLAVRVFPFTEATRALLLARTIGAAAATTPCSSITSTCRVLVSAAFMAAEVVKLPAGSPAMCSTILTGMQVLKAVAGEVAEPMLATIPAIPAILAVA